MLYHSKRNRLKIPTRRRPFPADCPHLSGPCRVSRCRCSRCALPAARDAGYRLPPPKALSGRGDNNAVCPCRGGRACGRNYSSPSVGLHRGLWHWRPPPPPLPPFAAFPGPQAPPVPNVPMPLITCPSATMSDLTPGPLKQAMIDKLGDKDALHHEVLFDSIAIGFSLAFLLWLGTQPIMLVMGKGPIPSFAPPYVPVGPVVMGDNIPTPGHLMI